MLAGVLALATGCTAPTGPPGPSRGASSGSAAGPATRATAAQSVLDALAQAARGRDRAAFDRLVSARDPSFADRARQLYGNLSGLPLDRLVLRLQPGERRLSEGRRRLLGPESWRQPATVTWRLAGETADAEHSVWVTFAVEDGAPRLAGTVDRPAGPVTPVPVWWTGPVTAERHGAVTVVVGAGQPGGPWSDRVAAAVGQVRRRVSAGAGATWDGSVVVEVPATRRDFEAVLGAADGSYAAIAAVTTAEGPAAGAVRIVVNPEVTQTLAPVGVAVVLLHETVHVATRSTDSPAPTWVVEGLADHVALQVHPEVSAAALEPLAARVRAQGAPQQLPADDQFRAGAPGLAASYAEAWLACRSVAEQHGEGALQRLYTALDDGVPLEQAAPDVLGVDVARLTADWRRLVLRTAGG